MDENVRELVCEMADENAIVFDNPSYDDAIVGVSHDNRVIYDYDKMIASLIINDGMEVDEAIEFIDYNTIRAIPYAGENAPIVMMSLSRLEVGD